MLTPKFVSVVAPFYNEEKVIAEFIMQLSKVMQQHFSKYEIILVDDGSTDKTSEICRTIAQKNLSLRIISLSRNYGHEIALTAGIEHSQGDYVIQIDADLQHPPQLIPILYEKIIEGYDVVYAERRNRDKENFIKKSLTRLFYYIANKMTGLTIPNNATNFRIINRKVVDSITRFKENNRHLLMLYAYLGFKTAAIPFDIQPRYAGQTKYSYRKLINLALDSIISFSHRPLRYMSVLSVFISMILVFYAGYILLQKFFYDEHLADGVASVIFITSGLFAILFLFLAIISEYISRILVESKNRPLYYVKEIYHDYSHPQQ